MKVVADQAVVSLWIASNAVVDAIWVIMCLRIASRVALCFLSWVGVEVVWALRYKIVEWS